jgi:hypothetical protein
MPAYVGESLNITGTIRDPETNALADPGSIAATIIRPDESEETISGTRVELGKWKLPPIEYTMDGEWVVIVRTTLPRRAVKVIRRTVLPIPSG